VPASATEVRVHRLFDGAPILAPTQRAWESGVTFNAAATFLPHGPGNDAIINSLAAANLYRDRRLCDGVVAIHYRARPRNDPGRLFTRSYIGLALFTPGFELLYRFPEPVLSPDPDPEQPDSSGVEDPRITRIGDVFHMVYCGSSIDTSNKWAMTLCGATSYDLLNWKKTGPLKINYRDRDRRSKVDGKALENLPWMRPASDCVCNKDGVVLPDRINGQRYLLHRPMLGEMSNWAMHLACTTDSVADQWHDCGPILHAMPKGDFVESWVGAGDVPLSLGDNRYLTIAHTGNLAADKSRLYVLDALVLNFDRFKPEAPESIIESRLDGFMVPATQCEIEGPYPDSVGNVLFSCGSFLRDGELYIVYGGGDTYLMAARVNLAELLSVMKPASV